MLPASILKNIQSLLDSTESVKVLKKASKQLTKDYRAQTVQTKRGFSTSAEALAYIAARMPATFAAMENVLSNAPIQNVSSILDLGAGPGTAALAAALRWPSCSKFHLIEGDKYMKDISQQIFLHVPEIAHQGFSFQQSNILELPIKQSYDLVLMSYVLNELSNLDQIRAIEIAWTLAIQGIVIVVPGTPKGYEQLMKARDVVINLGGIIAAPCPHNRACPLQVGDWCHFTTRLSRSSSHRNIKGAALPYEDEKFSYIIALKEFLSQHNGRIIRKPLKRSGHITLDLCMPNGIQRKTISKRDKLLYKSANSCQWGDIWFY